MGLQQQEYWCKNCGCREIFRRRVPDPPGRVSQVATLGLAKVIHSVDCSVASLSPYRCIECGEARHSFEAKLTYCAGAGLVGLLLLAALRPAAAPAPLSPEQVAQREENRRFFEDGAKVQPVDISEPRFFDPLQAPALPSREQVSQHDKNGAKAKPKIPEPLPTDPDVVRQFVIAADKIRDSIIEAEKGRAFDSDDHDILQSWGQYARAIQAQFEDLQKRAESVQPLEVRVRVELMIGDLQMAFGDIRHPVEFQKMLRSSDQERTEVFKRIMPAELKRMEENRSRDAVK